MRSKLFNLKFNKNFKFQISNYDAGFTLIEVIVAMVLIGILSAFILMNIGNIKKARDGRRKADLKQIEKALEQYRSDNGSYPTNSGITDLVNCPTTSSTFFGNAVITPPPPQCSAVYLNKVPTDPGGSSYWYSGKYLYYSLDGLKYYLVACAEDSKDKEVLDQATLQNRINDLFGANGVGALSTLNFSTECKTTYGYLIIGQ